MPPSPVPISALLDQVEWARRLARALVRDPGEADDLVQESYVRALTSAGRAPSRPQAWLARVVRNVWLERRREAARRAAREAAAARAEPTGPTDELVARAELQRDLAEAVLALPERQREVVLLRHFEGLAVAEVAGRLGITAEAVRARLDAGYGALRRRLDPDGARRRAFALLACTAPRPPAAATSVTLLVTAVSSTKLLLGAALVAALVSAWFALRAAPARPEAAAPPRASSPSVAERAAPDPGARAAVAPEAAPAPTPAASEDPPPPAPAPQATAALTGVVFGPDGAPAEGRAVRLLLVVGADGQPGAGVELTSGPGGAFEASALAPGDWVAQSIPTAEEVRRAGLREQPELLAVQSRVSLRAGERAHVELGAPSRAEVRLSGVVRLADGAPVPAFVQWLPEGADPLAGQVMARCDAAGRYEVTLAAPGRWRAGVSARDLRAELLVDVPARPSFERDLLLPGGAIAARYVDGAGAPVVGAAVSLHVEAGAARPIPPIQLGRVGRTDAEGRVAFGCLPAGRYGLACGGRAEGADQGPLAARYDGGLDVAEGPSEERLFELGPGATLSGVVTDGEGRPVRAAAVFVRTADGAPLDPMSTCLTDAEGRYTTPPLPDGVVSLQAWAGPLVSGPTPTFVAGPGAPATPPPPTALVVAPAAVARVALGDLDPATATLSVRDEAGLEHATLVHARRPWDWVEGGHRQDVLRIGSLAPGRYDVLARDAQGRERVARVVLAAGDDVAVTLRPR